MIELYDQISKLRNILEKLSSYVLYVSTEKNIEDILLQTIDICLELTTSDGATIYLKEIIENEEKLVIKATKNQSVNFEFYLGYSLPINSISIAGYVASNRKPVVINNTLSLPENHEYRQFKFFDRSLHYITINTITVPIFDYTNRVIGVLQVVNKKAKPQLKLEENNAHLFTIDYTDNDARIILAISALLGIILDRIWLHQKNEQLITNTQKMLSNIFDSVKKSILTLNDIMLTGQQKFIEYLQAEKRKKVLEFKEGFELCKKQIELSKVTETIITVCYLSIETSDNKLSNIFYEVLSSEIRIYDIPVMVKENEYVLLLYNVDLIKAKMIAKRIERKMIEKANSQNYNFSFKTKWSFYEIKPSEEKTLEEICEGLKSTGAEL